MRKNLILSLLCTLPITAFAITPIDGIQNPTPLVQFKTGEKMDGDIVLSWCVKHGQSCW